jgi:hypothetical protein
MKVVRQNHRIPWVNLALFLTLSFGPVKVACAQLEKLVQGSVYGIKVINVEKIDSHKLFPTGYISPLQPDHVLLRVRVEFFKHGVLKLDPDEQLKLLILDAKGEEYPLADQTHLEGGVKKEGEVYELTNFLFLFSIPKTSSGFKLRYRDLPLIDLGI